MSFWGKEEETVESIKLRRSRKMERFMRMQILPPVCKALLLSMLVLTPLGILSDVVTFRRYGTELGLDHLLRNAAVTAFSAWTIPAVLLIALSIFQLHRLKKGFVEKKAENKTPADFGDHTRYYESAFTSSKKSSGHPESKYRIYCAIAVVGILLFGISLFCVFLL